MYTQIDGVFEYVHCNSYCDCVFGYDLFVPHFLNITEAHRIYIEFC